MFETFTDQILNSAMKAAKKLQRGEIYLFVSGLCVTIYYFLLYQDEIVQLFPNLINKPLIYLALIPITLFFALLINAFSMIINAIYGLIFHLYHSHQTKWENEKEKYENEDTNKKTRSFFELQLYESCSYILRLTSSIFLLTILTLDTITSRVGICYKSVLTYFLIFFVVVQILNLIVFFHWQKLEKLYTMHAFNITSDPNIFLEENNLRQ